MGTREERALREPLRAKLMALSDALVAAAATPAPVAGAIVARALIAAYASDADAVGYDEERSIVRSTARAEEDVLREPMTHALEGFLVARGDAPARARYAANMLARMLLNALEEAAREHPERLRDDAFARALGALVARAIDDAA
jgi:hypothetical protein